MANSFVNKSAPKYWAEAIGTCSAAPLVGAAIAGWAYREVFADD